MPAHFIHEPWLAPENVQRAAKCIIGKDYPLPIVNHASASRINIQRMKQVYQQLTNYKLMESTKYDFQQVNVVSMANSTIISVNNQSI